MFPKRVLFMKHHRLGLLLVFGVAMTCPAPARAWTEFLSMDVLPDSAGWATISDGGSSVVNGGILTITSPSFREYYAPATWINTVSIVTGYTIEFRMRIVSAGHCYPYMNVGVVYHDNSYLSMVGCDPDRVYMAYPDYPQTFAALDVTQWHTYRIVVLGTHHQVFVDGDLTIDFQHPGTGGGARILTFGDVNVNPNCPSVTEWDYFAYETDAVVPVAQTTWGRLKRLYRGAPGAAQPATQDR